MSVEELELSLIERDPAIQPRESMDQERITQYAEGMLAGIAFPKVKVFCDGEKYWLSSGFHRCSAAIEAGLQTIPAEVVEGTMHDAILDAASSNKEHDKSGAYRTNADKRRAVSMVLAIEPGWSDRRIAKHVGVNDEVVGRVRKQLPFNGTSDTRIGIDGKKYPAKKKRNPKKKTEPAKQDDNIESEVESEVSSTSEPLFVLDGSPEPPKPDSDSKFNETNDMVDWAKWTWNPVTGCEHNCFYCYARDIANRFYEQKFKPTYFPNRLCAPRNTKIPKAVQHEVDPIIRVAWRNCFVCSMADLFGRWVPNEWIEGVFESCRQSPQWNYLFLTKFPQRYVGLDFPKTSWVGTSVDEQKRVANAEKAFAKITAPVKWLSVEPMLEPIKFNDLSMFDWVVIGGASRSTQSPESFPDRDWVNDLIYQARKSGCAVYCKPNTDPNGHWSGIWKQYPSAFTEAPV